jgi:hypothetical protein
MFAGSLSLLCLLAACRSPEPEPKTAPVPRAPFDTGATGSVELTALPSCGSVRTVQSVGGPGDQLVLATTPGPDGASDLIVYVGGPTVLDPGGPNEVEVAPRGESADVVVRVGADGAVAWALPLDGPAWPWLPGRRAMSSPPDRATR